MKHNLDAVEAVMALEEVFPECVYWPAERRERLIRAFKMFLETGEWPDGDDAAPRLSVHG